MPKKAPSPPLQMPPMHERYNEKHWLLRDIISVHVDVLNNNTFFRVYLTRVPCVGERITYGRYEYRVLCVVHHPVNDDGRAEFGDHSSVEAEWLPEEPRPPGRQKKKRQAEK